MSVRYAFILTVLLPAMAHAEIIPAAYDPTEFRDASTLEIRVLQDWAPVPTDATVRQKLIEITVCEWWPGRKVRVPVTLVAPVSADPCRQIIINNTVLRLRPALPGPAEWRLLKERGVGLVLVGMGNVEDMAPVGKLHLEMKEQLLATKNTRFTPAWIWGMSVMRALTAALAESDVYRPAKVLATGRSKGGMAAAAAGIHDARITAIMPLIAPPLGDPMPFVLEAEPAEVARINEEFLTALDLRKSARLPDTTRAALVARERDGHGRPTLSEVREVGWTETEIAQVDSRAWDVCRIVPSLSALHQRGLAIFYVVGTNDNVTPSLVELGRQVPDFPISIVPGGQHGGPLNAGFTLRVPALPEVDELRYAFAQHHFFDAQRWCAPPSIRHEWDAATRRLRVTVTFTDGTEPEQNLLWWAVDRHPPHTLPYEYDLWQAITLQKTGLATFSGELVFSVEPPSLDFVTTHTMNGLAFFVSSPLQRREIAASPGAR